MSEDMELMLCKAENHKYASVSISVFKVGVCKEISLANLLRMRSFDRHSQMTSPFHFSIFTLAGDILSTRISLSHRCFPD